MKIRIKPNFKKKLKSFYILLLLYFNININTAICQSFYFKTLNTSNGFPASTIYSSYNDLDGSIWFTTDIGIVIYDSKEYKIINTDLGTTDNEIFKMF